MTLLPNSLEARDVAYYFHPATNARRHERLGPLVMESGRGVYVRGGSGQGISRGAGGPLERSGRLRRTEAGRGGRTADGQAALSPTHSFSGQIASTGDRARRAAGEFLAGGRIAKAQFTSPGSEANDTVVKLVWYYNNALGRPRKKKIISRQRGYHGVTVAAAWLTGLPNFHREFDLPLPFVHTDCAEYWRGAEPGETRRLLVEARRFEALIHAKGPIRSRRSLASR